MGDARHCEKLQPWISACLDGEVGAWRHGTVQRHLAECTRCRALAAHLRQLKDALRRQAQAQERAPLGLWGKVEWRLEQVEPLPAPRGYVWIRRGLVPALGVVAVVALLVGLGLFHRGAVLGPQALAAEFPKHGGLLLQPSVRLDAEAIGQMSRTVGFEVSPPDLSRCGFALVGGNITEVSGFRGVSFVYRRGCEVVVVSQFRAAARLEGFSASVGKGGQRIHEATVRDLKLVVWEEGDRLSGLSCSQQVFVGPMGRMRCR